MNRIVISSLIALSLSAGASAQAGAQSAAGDKTAGMSAAQATPPAETSALESKKPSWTLQFEPAAWYVAPSGKIKLPSSTDGSNRLKLSALELDNTRLSPAGELHLRTSESWRFSVSAAYYSIGDRESTRDSTGRFGDINFVPGDVFNTKFSIFTSELTAAYAIVPQHAVGNDPDLLFGLDLVGGINMYNYDLKVKTSGGREASENLFTADPIIGVKADAEFTQHFTIDLQSTIGYLPVDNSSVFSWDITVGFAYRPVNWFGMQIGYRNLLIDLKDGSGADEFKWRGGLAGIYGGVEFRF